MTSCISMRADDLFKDVPSVIEVVCEVGWRSQSFADFDKTPSNRKIDSRINADHLVILLRIPTHKFRYLLLLIVLPDLSGCEKVLFPDGKSILPDGISKYAGKVALDVLKGIDAKSTSNLAIRY